MYVPGVGACDLWPEELGVTWAPTFWPKLTIKQLHFKSSPVYCTKSPIEYVFRFFFTNLMEQQLYYEIKNLPGEINAYEVLLILSEYWTTDKIIERNSVVKNLLDPNTDLMIKLLMCQSNTEDVPTFPPLSQTGRQTRTNLNDPLILAS